jgi:hypothetical protein
MNQLTIGRESIHIDVDDGQLTISLTAGALKDQSIGARDGNPPWSTNSFFCKVWEIERQDIVSSGIFTDSFLHKLPREWTNLALKTLEEAMESCIVGVIAKSQFGSSN